MHAQKRRNNQPTNGQTREDPGHEAWLSAAESQTLRMITESASLKDILTDVCASIDRHISPSISTMRSETDATSAMAETIAQDKDLTRMLLRSVGVGVPEGRPVRDVADAWDLPLIAAMQTDVPGAVGALPDALGEAGVRYLSVAHNWAGRSVPPFRYRNLGTLAAIGRRAAVVEFGSLQLRGFIGWLFWSVVHIYFLIGLRNRFVVALTWLWGYITFQRGARLITEVPPPRPQA